MELAASVELFICPSAPFLTPIDSEVFRACQTEYDERQNDNRSEVRWNYSLMNPRNRLNALPPVMKPQWRIDGCTAMGRQFFALPIFMLPDLPVKRIDIIIPCQSRHPHALRRTLRSSCLYGMSSRAINELEISQYILHVLDRWSSRQPYFEQIYRALPFGSKIIVESITSNIDEARVRFLPNAEFAKRLSTAKTLQSLWKLSPDQWPTMVALERLRHEAQLNNNVSIVRLPHLHCSKLFVFKTNLRSIKNMYHELKMLLIMEDHPNIISKPAYVVSIEDFASPSVKVGGFILEYYPSGTLRDVLDCSIKPTKNLQLRWSTQIVRTLCNILDGPARFYSDLKPDNLIVSHPAHDIIFIDFEQAGNWNTFQAPEVFYLEWMEKLAGLDVVPEEQKKRYKALVQTNIPDPAPSEEVYSNPPQGYYDAWTSLPRRQQELAMVFSVGKILWCIFEGCSHTRNSMDEKYEKKVTLEFPHFSTTPESLRLLIRRCTAGAPEWTSEEDMRIVREGPMFIPESVSGGNYDAEPSPKEAMDASIKLWTGRLRRMEAYVEAKSRWVDGMHDKDDELLLGFPLRPHLAEVFTILEEKEDEGAIRRHVKECEGSDVFT